MSLASARAGAGRVVLRRICAWLLNVTAPTMCGDERAIEIASNGLIAGVRRTAGTATKGGGLYASDDRRRASARDDVAHHQTITALTILPLARVSSRSRPPATYQDEHCKGHSDGADAELTMAGPCGWRADGSLVSSRGLAKAYGASWSWGLRWLQGRMRRRHRRRLCHGAPGPRLRSRQSPF